MARIAVLGLGAMGSRMACRLVDAGHDLIVWNRTRSTAESLAAAGAAVAATPREAAQDADAVVAMLRDDAASAAVWSDSETGAFHGMRAGAIAIESSTLTPARVQDWGRTAFQHEVIPVEAPVSGSRPQAQAGQLLYFLGGRATDVARAAELLAPLGSAFPHVGELGHGAVVKLVTNTLLALQVGAWSEMLPMMARQGLDMDRAIKALSMTSSWAPVAGYLAMLMRQGDHAPQFPVALVKKDLDYVATLGTEAALPLVHALRQCFDAGLAAGLGEENMTALVKLHAGDGGGAA